MKISEANHLGLNGEEVVKRWLSRHSYQYIPVSFLEWEDSKIPFEEFRLYWDNERLRHFGERGILSYEQNLENYQEYVKDWEYRIQKTHDFFGRKRREEKRVHVFMQKIRETQRKLNDERMKESERLYGSDEALHHLGSHTAMMPDLLARMPNLTFLEIKVNNSKLEPRQKLFLKIAKADGFDGKIARVLLKSTTSLAIIDYQHSIIRNNQHRTTIS